MIKDNNGHITHVIADKDDWRDKLCKCQKCGYAAECNVIDDFFLLMNSKTYVHGLDNPLFCTKCLWMDL